MATIRNRRGSVLLMAIGMLAIIAILASTFLIVSNLDALEAQTLSVKAQADPVAQGVLASVLAAIAADRHVGANNMPYGAIPIPSATPPVVVTLADYMDYPDETIGRGLDRWLAREYDWRDKIGLQVSHVDTTAGTTNVYSFVNGTTPIYNMYTASTDTYAITPSGTIKCDVNGNSTDGKYVDTDGDKIADACLYNTNVLCPGASKGLDANYWAAVRVVDLGARICVNTAGAGGVADTGTVALATGSSYLPLPLSPTPGMIDLNSYVGATAFAAIHDFSGSYLGRCGVTTSSRKMRNYDRYGAQCVLSPMNPSGNAALAYTPFATGDEMFLLMCDAYVPLSAKYSGRIYDLLNAIGTGAGGLKSTKTSTNDQGYLYGSNGGTGEPTDEVRRHLTTLSSVGACVRHAKVTTTDTGALNDEFQYLRPILGANFRPIASAEDCKPIYRRMYRMLTELNIGHAAGVETDPAKVRRKLAASFTANLWAYQSSILTGAPWAFPCPDDGTITAYGLRQDLVITQAFARHKKMGADPPADPNWAWAAAVEIANPMPAGVTFDSASNAYQLVTVVNGVDRDTIPLTGSIGAPGAATPQKLVFYSFDCGPSFADAANPKNFFGMTTAITAWKDTAKKLSFAYGKTASVIELRHSYTGTTGPYVTIDRVTADTDELNYDLASVDAIKIKAGAGSATAAANIRRDDRFKPSSGGQTQAFYNLALYYTNTTPTTNNTLGLATGCGFTTDGLIKQPMTTGTRVYYSPGIYRPRETAAVTDPNTSVGELNNVYLVGPIKDTAITNSPWMGFPQRMVFGSLNARLSAIFEDISTRGRLPIRPTDNSTSLASTVAMSYDGTPWTPVAPALVYPDVPSGALFGEFFTRLKAHNARPGILPTEAPRIYGQINVNTATKDVLMRLPWPNEGTNPATATNTLGLRPSTGGTPPNLAYSREDAVDYILSYRDMRTMPRSTAYSLTTAPLPPAAPDYSSAANRAAASTNWVRNSITGLRSLATTPASNYRGFLTPGEVAIPLGDYMEYLLTKTLPTPSGISTANGVRMDTDFPRARNALYAAIAECITTRSDVFGVYIHVQHDQQVPARYKWRYVAIVDRSCVLGLRDFPAILMFSEVK